MKSLTGGVFEKEFWKKNSTRRVFSLETQYRLKELLAKEECLKSHQSVQQSRFLSLRPVSHFQCPAWFCHMWSLTMSWSTYPWWWLELVFSPLWFKSDYQDGRIIMRLDDSKNWNKLQIMFVKSYLIFDNESCQIANYPWWWFKWVLSPLWFKGELSGDLEMNKIEANSKSCRKVL